MARVRWSRFRWEYFGAFVLLLAMVVLVVGSSTARPLKPVVVTTAEWPPYVTKDGGPVLAFVEQVFAAAGYTPDVRFTTWTLAQSSVTDGVSIAGFPFIDSRLRREAFEMTRESLTFDYAIFFKAGSPDESVVAGTGTEGEPDSEVCHEVTGSSIERKIDELNGTSVDFTSLGLAKGYDLWDDLTEVVSEERIELREVYDTTDDAFDDLEADRVSGVLESSVVGRDILLDPARTVDASRYTCVSEQRGLHILLPQSDQGRQLKEELDSAIVELEDSGTLAAAQAAMDAERIRAQKRFAAVRFAAPTDVVPEGSSGKEPTERLRILPGTTGFVHEWQSSPSCPDDRLLVKLTDGQHGGRLVCAAEDELETAGGDAA